MPSSSLKLPLCLILTVHMLLSQNPNLLHPVWLSVQVVDHANTIKQLQAADSIKSRLEASVREHIQGKAVAEAKLVRICILPYFPPTRTPSLPTSSAAL